MMVLGLALSTICQQRMMHRHTDRPALSRCTVPGMINV